MTVLQSNKVHRAYVCDTIYYENRLKHLKVC